MRKILSVFGLYVVITILTSCSHYCEGPYADRISKAIGSARSNKPADGLQFNCKPDSEQKLDGDTDREVVSYKFEVEGLCPGDEYALYARKLDGIDLHINDYVVSDELKLVSTLDGRLLENDRMGFGGFMKGEEISFALVCKNKDLTAAAIVSSNPIEATWNDGAAVTVTAASPKMDLFFMTGKGFTPNETYRFISRSWDEIIDSESKVEADGRLFMLLMPMVKGKDGGINRITLVRLATQEKRDLVIPYGSFAKEWRGLDCDL